MARLAVPSMFIAVLWLCACAGTDCADGKCALDTDDIDVQWGMSRLLALDPDDCSLLWGADFQGEHIAVDGLADGNDQVVVSLTDACWSEERQLAFHVGTGQEVPREGPIVGPSTFACDEFTTDAVPTMVHVGAVCVGESADAPGTLVAVDTLDGAVLWEATFTMDTFTAIDGVLLTQVHVAATDEHRVSRISTASGEVTWIYQQARPMTVIGADDNRVFLIDNTAFALDRNTGDFAFEYPVEGWSFQAPELAGGALLDGVLYVTRGEFPPSPCAD